MPVEEEPSRVPRLGTLFAFEYESRLPILIDDGSNDSVVAFANRTVARPLFILPDDGIIPGLAEVHKFKLARDSAECLRRATLGIHTVDGVINHIPTTAYLSRRARC